MTTEEIAVVLAMDIVVVFALSYLLSRILGKRMDRNITLYQSELIEKHFDEVENMYRQTRGWRHDYHNHIQTMKAYLSMGKLSELGQYLNELEEDLTTVDTVIKTGNVMIDAILNNKISMAKHKGIAVEAKAIVPSKFETDITEVDISIILGNLMDNAMEACMKLDEEEQRFIRVYIDVLKGQLYIYVMNAAANDMKRVGNRYVTTKDSRYHGLGLFRIDKVVEKYKGYLDRQHEEGVFATEIMLPL